MSHSLLGRNVLVTGATGSFGHAFVRRALHQGARRVVVYSRDELKQAQMAQLFADPRLRFFVGDVRDSDRLRRAMNGIEIVIHAAAMKRIETCEANPSEAVETNVTGTWHVAAAAIQAGVERAVFLSTDKASAAHTLYGATKLVAERLWVASNVYAAGGATRLACTRYGNVIGSRGSVLDRWRHQQANNLPLTLTCERATRFWMTITQAVDLVCGALDTMRGGEVFVPAIGSASVLDLARAVVGPDLYAPGHVETGLRPGERMHETLISVDEARHTYAAEGHYVIEPPDRTWADDVRALPWPLVASDFSYRSDTAPRIEIEELRGML